MLYLMEWASILSLERGKTHESKSKPTNQGSFSRATPGREGGARAWRIVLCSPHCCATPAIRTAPPDLKIKQQVANITLAGGRRGRRGVRDGWCKVNGTCDFGMLGVKQQEVSMLSKHAWTWGGLGGAYKSPVHQKYTGGQNIGLFSVRRVAGTETAGYEACLDKVPNFYS